MLRSTLPLLARAPLARPAVASRRPGSGTSVSVSLRASSSTTGSSASATSDYDQIMRPSASCVSFSSAARRGHGDCFASISLAAATAREAAFRNANCYRTVDEPTGLEDYDEQELHHPPCVRTRESHYESTYDPIVEGGEVASTV